MEKNWGCKSGVSLIELLISIVIVGLLANLGVMSYDHFLVKARQAEAKTALSGLYVAEKAFRFEYNTYGTQVEKIGFWLDSSKRYYLVGFPTTACNYAETFPPAPAPATPTEFSMRFPEYWFPEKSYFPRTMNVSSESWCYGQWRGPMVLGGTYPGDTVGASEVAFTASATGAVARGSHSGSPLFASLYEPSPNYFGENHQDVWTMDSNRNLINVSIGCADLGAYQPPSCADNNNGTILGAD